MSLMLEGWGRDQEGLRCSVLICGPLPRSLPRRGPLDTIFSQGERAAPGWYAALGIPLEGARACPFWVVSRPPAAPGEGGPAGREPRSPCREGSGAPRLPAGLRPGAGPAHRLGFLLWPVCVCVTEGREMGRRRRARQRESERDWSQRHRPESLRHTGERKRPETERDIRERQSERETAMDRMTDKRKDKTEKR